MVLQLPGATVEIAYPPDFFGFGSRSIVVSSGSTGKVSLDPGWFSLIDQPPVAVSLQSVIAGLGSQLRPEGFAGVGDCQYESDLDRR